MGCDTYHERREYYAWEEIETIHPPRVFKQVKKSYYLTFQLCLNVISALNSKLYKKGSSYTCFPTNTDPNEFYKRYSNDSDFPDR